MPRDFDTSTEVESTTQEQRHRQDNARSDQKGASATHYAPADVQPTLSVFYSWREPVSLHYIARVDSKEDFVRALNDLLRSRPSTSVDSSS